MAKARSTKSRRAMSGGARRGEHVIADALADAKTYAKTFA